MIDASKHHCRVLAILCAGVTLGCTGAIDQTGGGPAGDPTGQTPGPNGGKAGEHNRSTIPSPDTGLRRLTRTEYSNTVRYLLGTASVASNALDADLSFNGFDNNAEVLKRSVPTIDKYDAVANDLVEDAFRAGSASRKKLVTCDLVAGGTTCARTIISGFVHRAWRRPVANDEVDRLMTALDEARAQGESTEEGVKLAFRIALVSPNFLYRVEVDPAGTRGLHAVSPHELATRLSFFLWSSTPDDQLLARADDGTLVRPEVLTAELGRMLADAKASALVDTFASQWLATRAFLDQAQVSPDRKTFPTFDPDLRAAMAGEAQLFFRAFLKGDRNMADMLDTDFTFANARLAKHYGLQNVTGTQMQQVPAAGATDRFGLLSQGAFLTVTSNPNRTSPVKRGKWVLTRLLCSPPPPPPPSMPPFPDDPKSVGLGVNATVRQVMEAHRQNPTCAGCHAAMDPIGFALEHYNGIGGWRYGYPKSDIDATGEFNGTKFDGAWGLSKLIKEDPRFVGCFARTLFSYALGREASAEGDQGAAGDIAFDVTQNGGRIREAIQLVATSNAFQLRGGQP